MTWEQRWHPLRREWVVVAAHRQNRPWSGNTQPAPPPAALSYEPECYLCPGNLRVGGERNEPYSGVFVFDNDHPCVGPAAPSPDEPPASVFQVRPATGLARVVCYCPDHSASLGELSEHRVADLLRVWQEQYRELAQRPEVQCVLTFENRGEAVGVSNPHPHCQIYATNFVFKTLEEQLAAEREHLAKTGRSLLADLVAAEEADGRRMLAANDTAVAFVPYFARYAYETYVVPRGRHESIADLSAEEVNGLARCLREVLARYDNLWQMPFPYVLVLHQAPTDGGDYGHHHFHIQIHPPLRKPDLLKFLAGPEIGGGCFISDTSPELKAAELQAVSGRHFRNESRTSP